MRINELPTYERRKKHPNKGEEGNTYMRGGRNTPNTHKQQQKVNRAVLGRFGYFRPRYQLKTLCLGTQRSVSYLRYASCVALLVAPRRRRLLGIGGIGRREQAPDGC